MLIYISKIQHRDKIKYFENIPHFTEVSCVKYQIDLINLFSTNVSLLYPLKTSENPRFSDVFRGIEVEHWLKMG